MPYARPCSRAAALLGVDAALKMQTPGRSVYRDTQCNIGGLGAWTEQADRRAVRELLRKEAVGKAIQRRGHFEHRMNDIRE